MKKNILIILMFFCLVEPALACTFVPESFCRTAEVYEESDEDFIIANGYISGIDEDGINFEIISIVKGIENKTNIRIWDGTDFDCNGPFSMAASDFGSINDTLILILPKIDSLENTWDQIGDYRRPDNYGYTPALSVKNDIVNGFIEGTWGAPPEDRIDSLPYHSFINSWLIENDCFRILSSNETEKLNHCVLYPNPSKTHFSVVSDDIKNDFNLKIIDQSGKVSMAKNNLKTGLSINIDELSAGLYFVIIEENGKRIHIESLVKM